MGLFGDMGKPEEKSELPKEEKKQKFEQHKKQTKGKVASIIKGKRVIVDVDGNGVDVKYNERDHGHLKVGDPIVF
jgi:hypothetical protein